MEVFYRFCLVMFGCLNFYFFLKLHQNFKILRKKRRELLENEYFWAVFDDFSLYTEPVLPSSVYSVTKYSAIGGCSFNGNYVTSLYHEEFWYDWHI